MAAEEEQTKIPDFEDKIALIQRMVSRQQWLMLGFIPLMLIVLVIGILSLGGVHKKTSALVADKPENRAESYAVKISSVQNKVEQQYQQHLSRMEDPSILTVNEKFRAIYELSQQSERDYAALLELYQKMAYDSASRVKGSGEWYYYYERKVADSVKKAKDRESKMRQYFQSKSV
jgi:hypothetical protein